MGHEKFANIDTVFVLRFSWAMKPLGSMHFMANETILVLFGDGKSDSKFSLAHQFGNK